MMRVRPVLIAATIVAMAAPAFTQDWVEFASRDDRFSINFPAQPRVTQITYTSQFGADLPARVYSAESGQSRFRATVVDYTNIEAILTAKSKACPPGAEPCRGGAGAANSTGAGYWKADFGGAVIHATWQFMQRDAKVTYLGWNNINLVEGHMMSLTNTADKSRTSVGIYFHENRLYLLEGTVPDGYPEPAFFNQSIGFLDENGNDLRYLTLYHHGFPKPPLGRQGQGGRGAGAGQGGN